MGSTDGKTADISDWPFWPGSWDAFAMQTKTFAAKRLGFMRSRPGGFVSVEPAGASQNGSWLVTVPLTADTGTTLSINARCEQGGHIELEVLTMTAPHSSRTPMAGFSGTAAAVFSSDSTRARLRWPSADTIGWGKTTLFAVRVKLVGQVQLFGLIFDKLMASRGNLTTKTTRAKTDDVAATVIGGVKQLVVDDSLTDLQKSKGVTRTMNPPAKLGHRLLQPGAGALWEHALVQTANLSSGLYGSVLREGGDATAGGEEGGAVTKTRLWYYAAGLASAMGGEAYLSCCAEAPDGINFAKPALGQKKLNGTAAAGMGNNIVGGLIGATQREGNSVWIDERRSLGGRYVSQAKVASSPVIKDTTVGNISVAGMLGFSVSDDGLVWRDAAFMDAVGPTGTGGGVSTSVAKLAGRPVKLRFVMQGCKLFAFQFV